MLLRQERFGWLQFDKRTSQLKLYKDQDTAINCSECNGARIIRSDRYHLPTISAPLKIFLEITNNCNLFCTFCSNNSGKGENVRLTTGQIEMLIDSADEMGIFEVGIIGGEPLCHPDFFEIIRIIKKYGFPIYLNTNGIYNKSVLHMIRESGIDKIKVSLDGLKDCHENIRGRGTFNKTVSNIRYLKSHGNDVQINFTANKDNEKDIESLISLSDELGCPLKIAPMIPVGRAKNIVDKMIAYDDWLKICKRIVGFIGDFRPKIKVEIASGFITDSCDEVISKYCFLYTDCGVRGSFLSVNCHGDVFNTGKQTEFDSQHKVGNINDSSLQEIWDCTDKNNLEYFNLCGKCSHRKIDVLFSDSFKRD